LALFQHVGIFNGIKDLQTLKVTTQSIAWGLKIYS